MGLEGRGGGGQRRGGQSKVGDLVFQIWLFTCDIVHLFDFSFLNTHNHSNPLLCIPSTHFQMGGGSNTNIWSWFWRNICSPLFWMFLVFCLFDYTGLYIISLWPINSVRCRCKWRVDLNRCYSIVGKSSKGVTSLHWHAKLKNCKDFSKSPLLHS